MPLPGCVDASHHYGSNSIIPSHYSETQGYNPRLTHTWTHEWWWKQRGEIEICWVQCRAKHNLSVSVGLPTPSCCFLLPHGRTLSWPVSEWMVELLPHGILFALFVFVDLPPCHSKVVTRNISNQFDSPLMFEFSCAVHLVLPHNTTDSLLNAL